MTNWLGKLTGETQGRLLGLLRRSQQTIGSMAAALGLTDNAVRTHVAALGRDGLVESVGTQPVTVGKPARMYALTAEGEELFPKAYAAVLAGLVEEIAAKDGPEHAVALLRSVGERVAGTVKPGAATDTRVQAAAQALRDLGGDVDVERSGESWRIQGYGCPLSAVTATHPEVCALAQALIERITGRPVTECCDRSGRPRCAFTVS